VAWGPLAVRFLPISLVRLMKCLLSLFLVFAALPFCAASASAAIVVDASTFDVENSAESITIAGFTLADNTNRTLVVTVGGERSDTIGSLTFDGTPLIQAALNHTGQTHASVWYLDVADSGGAVTGDVALSWSGSNNGFYMGVYSLYNVAAGGPALTDDDGNDTGSDIVLAYASAAVGDLIIESVATQGPNTNPAITSPVGLTELYNAFETDGGGYGAATGHISVSSSGAVFHTWQFSDLASGPRVRAAGALFTAAPVPEPTTMVFGLFGAMAAACVTRRRTVDR
jgi:hypothetical protein